MPLQLCDFLLTLLAKASLLLRLGDGNRPGALRRRSATAPRVLRRVESLPGGNRRLSTRASLHLQHREKVWLTSIARMTTCHTSSACKRESETVCLHLDDPLERRAPVQARTKEMRSFLCLVETTQPTQILFKHLIVCSETLTVNMRLLGSLPSGAALPPNELILPDQGYTFRRTSS